MQHFSVHDGPGIRTVVFVKGCPLRCAWCANPESQRMRPELAWNKGSCIGCESCVKSCSAWEFQFGKSGLSWKEQDTSELDGLNRLCPSQALHVIGEEKTVEEVLEDVRKDAVFYADSMGGLTVSGGEPLSQPEFVIPLLRSARAEGIHTAMESSSYGTWEHYREMAGHLNYLLTDIKTMDDEVHRKYTGVSNKLILGNIKRIRALYPNLPIQVRTPVIPGVNDREEDIRAIADFMADFSNVKYELLKYHRLGEPKYESLHRSYPMGQEALDEEVFDRLKKYEFDRIAD